MSPSLDELVKQGGATREAADLGDGISLACLETSPTATWSRHRTAI
jgi:hypothetical protein